MAQLEKFISDFSQYSDLAEVKTGPVILNYPLVSIHYGNKKGPALLLTGGVHGLERIGAQLTLSLLDSFHQRLYWDQTLQQMLTRIQVIFVPLVNPAGYFGGTRSNANGVDLMRNAPIEATDKVPFLLGGQRYSNQLPWYRGHQTEPENEFIFSIVKDLFLQTDTLISLDAHSGFGFRDQLWYPFAGSKKEFTQLPQLLKFFELFKKSHPYHIYKIEPQSLNYMTHGDVWDYCFLSLRQEHQTYLPLTLEMGSWLWVKKNPLQLFSKSGLFNPIKKHRLNRTLRRHGPLFDFLLHSLVSHDVWSQK